MAIGAGTQIAKAEADMVLVKSALTDVVVALDLARVVFSRIKLNFFFSIVYNVAGIPLAAGMFFPLIHRMMPPACRVNGIPSRNLQSSYLDEVDVTSNIPVIYHIQRVL
ncbi:hypothetical protein PR002_g24703 [Phytophthora rubi]|uniref:Uncharacterized protein n=2 Tax=Phytophthora rubi TaxID=129364 RepID=A0A6A3IEI6_9STRA|nr:hypothetical protein PR002_g24703 [Phytophthora rubi]